MSISALSFLADAAAAPPSIASYIIPFACFALIMYAISFRPQQKKEQELKTLIASVKTGDKVVITGGIHGIVSNVKDGSTFSLKVADNVKIEVEKSSIVSVDRSGTTAAAVVSA